MKSCRSEIERLIPVLRQVARALVEKHRADIADDLVHEALEDAIRGERAWAVSDIETRLFTRLIGANRLRLHAEADERRTLPGVSAHGESTPGRPGSPPTPPRPAGEGLEGLALGDREVLLLVVLGHVDYPRAAEILGVPTATVIARLTHARDTLGSTLWAAPGGMLRPRAAGSHLRLVKY